MKSKGNPVGSWAFIIGVIIAVIAGLFKGSGNPWVVLVLVIIGLIVGILNITGKEAMSFLLASTALVIISTFGQSLGAVSYIGPYLQSILSAILAIIVPATIIVALRAIWALAHD